LGYIVAFPVVSGVGATVGSDVLVSVGSGVVLGASVVSAYEVYGCEVSG
jgi:prefoldin subunit 5